MPIVPISEESIKQAADIILRGGLAAFPTETVYGLGGNAYNPLALAKIFEAKGRPRFDPLIVHIAELTALEKVADLSLLDSAAHKNLAALTEKFWPGPLTLILPKQKTIPDLATSGLPTVAVRLPAHETARRLIELSTGAIAAPSANPFGCLSPTRAEHVAEMLGDTVDIILDGGPARFGVESTVLDLCAVSILRPGSTEREAIEALIGPVDSGPSAAPIKAAPSPGMLQSHYAPRTPLIAHDTLPRKQIENNAAYLFFDGASRDRWLSAQEKIPDTAVIAVLSESGNITEAASRLFETLHKLDKLEIALIHAQLAPQEGLGAAINDRLRRASSNIRSIYG